MTSLSLLVGPHYLPVSKQVKTCPGFTSQPLSDVWPGHLDTQHFIQVRHADMLHRSSTGAYSPRWKTVSVYLTDNEFCHTGLLEAFNQKHPEASVLTVFWNNEAVAQYLPLQDNIQVHTDSETRMAYLDWARAVIKNFDALIQFSRETA